MDIEEESTQTSKSSTMPGPMDADMEQDDARQAIDMLRGEDLSERIAAANKLESIAKTLGEERTREVSRIRSCHVV